MKADGSAFGAIRAPTIGVTLLRLASSRNRFQSTPRSTNASIAVLSTRRPDAAQHHSNSSLAASSVGDVAEFILIVGVARCAVQPRILVDREARYLTLVLIAKLLCSEDAGLP